MKNYSFQRRKVEKFFERLVTEAKLFKYRNILFLVSSILLAYYILSSAIVLKIVPELQKLSYLGIFFVGIFYSSTLTTAPATAVLHLSGKVMNPFVASLVAACGSVAGDYVLFKFIKENLIEEVKKLSEELNNKLLYRLEPLSNLIFTRNFRIKLFKFSRSEKWKSLLPIISAIIIASPLPDELAVALLGAAKYEKKKFVVFSYLCNFFGILFISYLGTIF
jgi:uncharacterized membrane protein YdjX (TVP38/TMEM64 family)